MILKCSTLKSANAQLSMDRSSSSRAAQPDNTHTHTHTHTLALRRTDGIGFINSRDTGGWKWNLTYSAGAERDNITRPVSEPPEKSKMIKYHPDSPLACSLMQLSHIKQTPCYLKGVHFCQWKYDIPSKRLQAYL